MLDYKKFLMATYSEEGGGGSPPSSGGSGGSPPPPPPSAGTTYTITVTPEGNGSASPSGIITVFGGSSKQFNFIADSGYEVSGVLVNGSSIGKVTSYSINNINKNYDIEIAFGAKQTSSSGNPPGGSPPPPSTAKHYSLLASETGGASLFDSGANGSIKYDSTKVRNISGEYSIIEDAKFDFSIVPNKYYAIDDVKINGISAGLSGVYSIPSVTKDIQIDVQFKSIPIPAFDKQLLPTDFLFLKYDDGSIISDVEVSRDNTFENSRLRIYRFYINSAIESKTLNIKLDTINLLKLADPSLSGGSNYQNVDPYNIGATQLISGAGSKQLKPYISSSLFIVKSIPLVAPKNYIWDIELTEDHSIEHKNKPYLMEDKEFTFENNKQYELSFRNDVYYYNPAIPDESYIDKKDSYRSVIYIIFHKNGISDFKTIGLPTNVNVNILDSRKGEEIRDIQNILDNTVRSVNNESAQIIPRIIEKTPSVITSINLSAPNLRFQNPYFKRNVCKNCIFADGNLCKKYNFNFESGQVCDAWEKNGISKEYLYSNGDYLLSGIPYFGSYHLWASDSKSDFSAYTGNYFGELPMEVINLDSTNKIKTVDRQLLIFNNGIVKILRPSFVSESPSKSSTSTSALYSLDTIITSSMKNDIVALKSLDYRIKLNIDYSEFPNFILFSSAYDRLINFRNNIDQIDDYNFKINNIESLGAITHTELSQSLLNLKLNKDSLINKLDDFEKYLYFESGSIFSGSILPYPKQNTNRPYILYSTTSSISVDYFNTVLQSASRYDEENFNSLYNKLPEYFRNEGETQFGGYSRLIKMFAQYFDVLYVYAKDISNRKIENLKQKTNLSSDILPYLLDYYNLFDRNKKVETELSSFYLSSGSYANGSNEDYSNELYYRMLLNAPYIAKSRGTKKSIKAALNSLGIPENYLQIQEYGRNQSNFNDDVDEIRIKKEVVKRYYLDFKGSQNIKTNWITSSISNSVPNQIQLKFKSNNNSGLYTTQVLFESTSSASGSWAVILQNSGSTYGSSSAVVKFILSGSISCSTAELPIFNDMPWALSFSRDTTTYSSPTQSYSLNVNQFKFDNINFSSSVSLIVTSSILNNRYSQIGSFYLGGSSTSALSPSINGKPYYGEMAELRHWVNPLTAELNDNFIKASSFYGGTHITSSFTELVTWLRLDQDINHYSTSSVHDYNLTGVKNHGTSSNFENAADDSNYLNYFEEEQYELQNFDIQSPSDEKIYIVSSSLTTNALSPNMRVEKTSKKLYGEESNKLSIDISTNTLLNNDLFKSFDFELDNFIGDPRYQISESYDSLDNFRLEYLKKYGSNAIDPYLVFDQASGYDSSVFEIVKKNIPFKADLKYGFRVEQTGLERFKTKNKLSLSSTYMNLNSNIQYDGIISGINSNHNIIINYTSDIDYTKSTADTFHVANVSLFDDQKILFKQDKYGTPLSRVPGFSKYAQTSILPASEPSNEYSKTGITFYKLFDTAIEPTWATIDGLLTTQYSSNHISKHRDTRGNILRIGVTQVEKCDLDGRSVIEIVKTTSKTPIVFDSTDGDAILRAE